MKRVNVNYQFVSSFNGNKSVIVFSRVHPTQSFFTTNVMQNVDSCWKVSTHYLPERTPDGKTIKTIDEFKARNAYWLGKEVANPRRRYSPYLYQEECLMFSWVKNKRKWRRNKRLWKKFSKHPSVYVKPQHLR